MQGNYRVCDLGLRPLLPPSPLLTLFFRPEADAEDPATSALASRVARTFLEFFLARGMARVAVPSDQGLRVEGLLIQGSGFRVRCGSGVFPSEKGVFPISYFPKTEQ